MLFPTLDFALFFLVIFLASWAINDKFTLRKWLLLAASYFFYGYWDWRFLALLAGSSTINYISGRVISAEQNPARRKLYVAIAVTLNLGVLGFFKYYGFFLNSLAEILFQLGLQRDLPFLEIILPVGISFFTFQGISYVVDVYRRDIKPVESPLDLFLYISFFPQLVAGPIVRASHFLPQLRATPKLNREMVAYGFTLIVLGLFKKSVLASYIASELVDEVFFDPTLYGTVDLLAASYGFAVQVYCDFSAYSDIAIGVAALLGYRFRANFDRPLGATSLQQLWQRWHISLSTFLRDYLYRTLRGNKRGGTWTLYRNTFLTMLIGGLWHGAAWTFVTWGAIHGAALVIERILTSMAKPLRLSLPSRTGGRRSPGGSETSTVSLLNPTAVGGWFITFHVFALAAIFFRAPSFGVAFDYIARMLTFSGEVMLLTPFVTALIVGSVAAQFLPGDLAKRSARLVQGMGPIALGLYLGFGILLVELMSQPGVQPFIYFQF